MFWLGNHICIFGTQIVHSRPKHKFCIFLHSEGIENDEKHSRSSFWVQWSSMDALVTKPFSQLRYPEIVHPVPKHMYYIFFTPKVSEMP
jgi:hypothetical protein